MPSGYSMRLLRLRQLADPSNDPGSTSLKLNSQPELTLLLESLRVRRRRARQSQSHDHRVSLESIASPMQEGAATLNVYPAISL
jgi:hypothetical protein